MASRIRSLAASSSRVVATAAFGMGVSLATLCAALAADELGLEGPGVAPLDQAVFSKQDLRPDAAPLFTIAPDSIGAAVFHDADLKAAARPAWAPPAVLASGAPEPIVDPLIIVARSPADAPPPFALAAPVEQAPAPALAPAAPEAPIVAKSEPAAPDAVTPIAMRAALAAKLADPALRGRAGQALRKWREELAQVYAARDDAPAWIVGGAWTPAARGAFERLRRADEDGMDLGAARIAALGDPSVDSELRLSEAVVVYARQAAGGRVDPWRVSSLITAKPPQVAAQAAIARVSAQTSPEAAGQALRDFNPPHPGYAALRDKLAEMRREQPKATYEPIPLGPTLRIGMRDARVALIRSRLGLGPDEGVKEGEPLVYDVRVANAVKAFQQDAGLPASGQLTPRTVAALSGGEPSRLEKEILANMERWRWLPRDLGETRIEVNIPDYQLALKDGARTALSARVVVGKPDSPTPVFSDLMRFLVVNPSWTMPPSILENEAIPNLASDPNYYTKRGYEVIRRGDKLVVRQPPGERNALGHVKFMFPNDHAVYLHDTPQRGLFSQAKRAYSHGCVRVDQPFRLAEAVLNGRFSEAALKKMVGSRERTISLAEPLPIHLTYFTAKVDEDGRLQLSDDIYGYSRRLSAAMGLDGASPDATAALGSTATGGRDDRSVLLADPQRSQDNSVSRRKRSRLLDPSREHRDGGPVQAGLPQNFAQQSDAGDRRSGAFGWFRAGSGVRVGRDPALSR